MSPPNVAGQVDASSVEGTFDDGLARAIDIQVGLLLGHENYLNNRHVGVGVSIFKGYAIGGYILKANWSKRSTTTLPVVDPYIVDEMSQLSDNGYNARGGFSGPVGITEKNAAALVIVVRPDFRQTDILGNTEFYSDISRRIQAPVIVIGNDNKRTVFFGQN